VDAAGPGPSLGALADPITEGTGRTVDPTNRWPAWLARRLQTGRDPVLGINSRLDNLLQWLDEARPDVACLQEIKVTDDRFPFEALERAGYGAAVKG